ncbi:MAG: sigma-70 family RNA polymerase sigma factor [Candidatus Eisenbacteria bacterium]|nr:sigma-70 family RNA polymerase sigma factor [Candidatus Eisenbacteria bacterium]
MDPAARPSKRTIGTAGGRTIVTQSQRPGRATRHDPGWDPVLLVERFADRIYRFLLSLTGDEDMARDLTQETFLKLHRSRGPDDPAAAAAYVFAAARNTALSRLRRRLVEGRHLAQVPSEDLERLHPAPSHEGPERKLEARELSRALRQALEELPEILRAAFLLSEIEELSYAEIGRILDCPPGTVASRKHLAVQRLRRSLRRFGHGV